MHTILDLFRCLLFLALHIHQDCCIFVSFTEIYWPKFSLFSLLSPVLICRGHLRQPSRPGGEPTWGPFNVIFHAPSDEFHLVKEGVGKMLIKRLFEDSRTVLTREIMSAWSTSYEGMLVFTETARYTRFIDTGAMKGNELGIVIYASFPVLVAILAQQESERW